MRERHIHWALSCTMLLFVCAACASTRTHDADPPARSVQPATAPVAAVPNTAGRNRQGETTEQATSTQQQKATTRAAEQDAADDDKNKLPTEKIRIGKHLMELDVAADTKSRATGLMEHKKLTEDDGMIFVYATGTRTLSFWMKNCVLDIDIAFLNSQGKVVALHEMKAEEPQGKDESLWDYEDRLKLYGSKRPAQYAVELKSGMIKKLAIEVGDQLEFDRAKLSKLARENERREADDDGGLFSL